MILQVHVRPPTCCMEIPEQGVPRGPSRLSFSAERSRVDPLAPGSCTLIDPSEERAYGNRSACRPRFTYQAWCSLIG